MGSAVQGGQLHGGPGTDPIGPMAGKVVLVRTNYLGFVPPDVRRADNVPLDKVLTKRVGATETLGTNDDQASSGNGRRWLSWFASKFRPLINHSPNRVTSAHRSPLTAGRPETVLSGHPEDLGLPALGSKNATGEGFYRPYNNPF
jgi:hypothetical protein